jgi:hypothetical protein
MDQASGLFQPQLFAARMWREELGAGQREWRGEVHDVVSGERRYFREWPALIASLQALLAAQGLDRQQVDPPNTPE